MEELKTKNKNLKINIQELENNIKQMNTEIHNLKIRLKKYTAPSRSKRYYQNNKEKILRRNKEYQKRTNYKYIPSKEKKKEYNRRAYLKRKETKI